MPTLITNQIGLQMIVLAGCKLFCLLQQHPLHAACIARSALSIACARACTHTHLTKERRKANGVKRTATLSTCHVRLYVYMCIYVSIMSTCLYVHMSMYVYTSTCLPCLRVHVCIYIYIYIYMFERASTQAHTCNAQVPENLGPHAALSHQQPFGLASPA